MMASAGAVLSGIMWLQQLHDHRWVAPVPYGPRPRSNAQLNRPSIDYATALVPQVTNAWVIHDGGDGATYGRSRPCPASRIEVNQVAPLRGDHGIRRWAVPGGDPPAAQCRP